MYSDVISGSLARFASELQRRIWCKGGFEIFAVCEENSELFCAYQYERNKIVYEEWITTYLKVGTV